MARGRLRKTGQRFPSGKLKPARKVQTAIHRQRELEVLRTTSKLSHLGTPVGELFREGDVTASQFEAARQFAEARSAADAALGLPPRTPRAQDMNAVGGRSNANDDDEAARLKNRAIAAYDRAEMAVGHGSSELAALQWVVVYERRHDGFAQKLALMAGLTKLVAHYGIK
jgi:hypothetical protein